MQWQQNRSLYCLSCASSYSQNTKKTKTKKETKRKKKKRWYDRPYAFFCQCCYPPPPPISGPIICIKLQKLIWLTLYKLCANPSLWLVREDLYPVRGENTHTHMHTHACTPPPATPYTHTPQTHRVWSIFVKLTHRVWSIFVKLSTVPFFFSFYDIGNKTNQKQIKKIKVSLNYNQLQFGITETFYQNTGSESNWTKKNKKCVCCEQYPKHKWKQTWVLWEVMSSSTNEYKYLLWIQQV